jgi:hypothetical protein
VIYRDSVSRKASWCGGTKCRQARHSLNEVDPSVMGV